MDTTYISFFDSSTRGGPCHRGSREFSSRWCYQEILSLLSAYAGSPGATPLLGKSATGKPLVLEPQGWYCSLSHSGPAAAVAVAPFSTGIDLETLRPGRDFQGIADLGFGPDQALLPPAGSDRYLPAWYHLWTSREAWVKKDGLGVWDLGTVPPLALRDPGSTLTWTLVNLDPGSPRYSLSLTGERDLSAVPVVWSGLGPWAPEPWDWARTLEP